MSQLIAEKGGRKAAPQAGPQDTPGPLSPSGCTAVAHMKQKSHRQDIFCLSLSRMCISRGLALLHEVINIDLAWQ